MTEQEYINVKELGTVTAAINVLRDICVENSKVIYKEDYQQVMKKIRHWERCLFRIIKTTEK